MRAQFLDATVLTIAHRLHTIMDANRVLILDHGRVAEFDSPTRLLEHGGVFASMYHSSQV